MKDLPKKWKIRVLGGRPVLPDEISERCRLIVLEFSETVSIKDILRNLYDMESDPVALPGCVICRSGESWEAVIRHMLRRFAKVLTEEEGQIMKEIDGDETDNK